MGLYSVGLIIGEIFESDIWGVYSEGLIFKSVSIVLSRAVGRITGVRNISQNGSKCWCAKSKTKVKNNRIRVITIQL